MDANEARVTARRAHQSPRVYTLSEVEAAISALVPIGVFQVKFRGLLWSRDIVSLLARSFRVKSAEEHVPGSVSMFQVYTTVSWG
jgi:hypothetical protein